MTPRQSQPGSILVTGATGNVGRQVVSQLMGTGMAVRAAVRQPDAARLPDSVEVARADLSRPETLDAPLEGVEAVFLVWPFLSADGAAAILEAISPRARRVVYLSSMGVRDDLEQQTNPIDQFHSDLERMIRRSGLEWTILRSSGMATNTLWWAPQIQADDVVRWYYPAAVRALIHEADIAAIAARALTDDAHDAATYVLTGPQSLTQAEQVHIIGQAINRQLRYEEIPPDTARKQLLASLPAPVVDGILEAHAAFVTEPEPVTSTFEEITGAQARTFRRWATDHAEDFR